MNATQKVETHTGNGFSSTENEEENSNECNTSTESIRNKSMKLKTKARFSIWRSHSDGLRMKISAVKTTKKGNQTKKLVSKNNNNCTKINFKINRKISTGSSSSCCSVCSNSDTDTSLDSGLKKYSSKESEDPNKKDCTFRRINNESFNKNMDLRLGKEIDITEGECLSSSDTELPALVNAAIKSVENCPELETFMHDSKPQYTSSLLEDFMLKTQMLSSNSDINNYKICIDEIKCDSDKEKLESSSIMEDKCSQHEIKKKFDSSNKNVIKSPRNSSELKINHNTRNMPFSDNWDTEKKSTQNRKWLDKSKQKPKETLIKLDVTKLDKKMYATERTLYPPKNKMSKTYTKTKIEDIDPQWRKIDVNMRFCRPKLNGYKGDGVGTTCSKVLAAKSGYMSDYGSVITKHLSGYKSDTSGKSLYSLNSCISRAKSCDYGLSSSYRRNRFRKRRRKVMLKGSKSLRIENDQDILQLAGLTLGMSSNESINKQSPTTHCKKFGEISRFVNTGQYFSNKKSNFEQNKNSPKITTKPFFPCSKSLFKKSLNLQATSNSFDSCRLLSKKIKYRRLSEISRCSSVSSISRYNDKRKKGRRNKFRRPNSSKIIDSKIIAEIETMTNSFTSLCKVSCEKAVCNKEKVDREKSNLPHIRSTRRNVKKRKNSEAIEYFQGAFSTKRRHKRGGQQNTDEHRLPLKKRHYLLAPGEKIESKCGQLTDSKPKDNNDSKFLIKYATNTNSKTSSKAITSKKKHLLQSSNCSDSEILSTNADHSSQIANEMKPSETITDTNNKKIEANKLETSQKKKPRFDNHLKQHSAPKTNEINDVSVKKSPQLPPPGVFEPTIDYDFQIFSSKQSSPIVTEFYMSKISENDLTYKLDTSETNCGNVVESLLNKTGEITLKKKRKKAINKTGFPIIKKKKKKLCNNEIISKIENKNIDISSRPNSEITLNSTSCARVPKQGEQSNIFIERNKKPRLTIVSLERLQEPYKMFISKNEAKNSVKNIANHIRNTTTKSSLRKTNKRASSDVNIKEGLESSIIKQTEVKENFNDIKTENSSELVSSQCLSSAKAKTLKRKRRKRALWTSSNRKPKYHQQKIRNIKNNNKLLNGLIKTPSMSLKLEKLKHHISLTKDSGKAIIIKSRNKENCKNQIQQGAKNEDYEIDNIEQDPLPIKRKLKNDSNEVQEPNKKLNKAKKNYLMAGLLSDFYKTSKTNTNTKDIKIKSIINNSHTLTSLMPAPPYCEKYLRHTHYDFQIPYDIYWAYCNQKLPERVTVPSWNYRKIRTNVYGDVKANPAFEHHVCNCQQKSGCGDDCLNRMVYTECSPENCPCGDECQNRKIQKHEYSPGIERFMTVNKGWGIRTNQEIKKGSYILEYVGEVVTEKEFKERMATLYVNDTHHYCLHLDGGLVIDGHRMGSDGRFVNHSCSPNCEMQKWSVNGLSRMALFALRNIEPGEELTYDYNFSLFNPAEGQPCRCETPDCRGVIGGKSQRIKLVDNEKTITAVNTRRYIKPKKRQCSNIDEDIPNKEIIMSDLEFPSEIEKKLIKTKHCFLLRNLKRVRKTKENQVTKGNAIENKTLNHVNKPGTSLSNNSLNLSPIKTAEHTDKKDSDHEKSLQMSKIFEGILTNLETAKDTTGKKIIEKIKSALKKRRSSNVDFKDLLDFNTLKTKITKLEYLEISAFENDLNDIFNTVKTCFTPNSAPRISINSLLKLYEEKKKQIYDKSENINQDISVRNSLNIIENEIIDTLKDNEDIIKCICGLYNDEGLMIQCSKCFVWQHAECTKADIKQENYLCEKCSNKNVDLEIPLNEFTEEGYRYYVSLLRGDLQIRQGDTVYVLRDIPLKDNSGDPNTLKKHTYETIGTIDYFECDIFRVERLWKNNEGKRYIFGHHYLRPHETFHEPTRKFYTNEVVRVPLYEVIPIELVMARCWVLDKCTFCKGRPKDCTSEDHVYICELRVDKSARFFTKAKQTYPVCVKSYAFSKFKEKLKISRNFAPHDIKDTFTKSKKRKLSSEVSDRQQYNNIQPKLKISKVNDQKRLQLENLLDKIKVKKFQPNNKKLDDLSRLMNGSKSLVKKSKKKVPR